MNMMEALALSRIRSDGRETTLLLVGVMDVANLSLFDWLGEVEHSLCHFLYYSPPRLGAGHSFLVYSERIQFYVTLPFFSSVNNS